MSNSYGPYAPQDNGANQHQSGTQNAASGAGAVPGGNATYGTAGGGYEPYANQQSGAQSWQQWQAGPSSANPYDPASYPYVAPGAGTGRSNGTTARFFAWIRRSGITRSDDRWIGGVCGGLARYFNISPVLMRAIMIAAVLCGGFGAAFYAFAWFLLPDGRTGEILGERLIAGDWDWACLGVILCTMIGVGFPGSGIFLTAAAAFVLWLIIERELRRQRGYGAGGRGNAGGNPGDGRPYDGGFGGTQPYGSPYVRRGVSVNQPVNQPSNQPAGQPVGQLSPQSGPFTAPASGQSAPASGNPFMPSSDHDAASGQPIPGVPGAASASSNAASAPSASPAAAAPIPPFGNPIRPMTSPYRAPQPEPRPAVARRKPAGPIIVAAVLGLSCIFAAVALYTTNSYTLTSLIRSSTLWIGATCVLIGLVILALGIRGRRAGGLVPLAWLAGITAVCILAVNFTYTYIASRYSDVYRSYEVVDVHGYVDYDGTIKYSGNDNLDRDSAQFTHLSDGVVFDGTNYDNDLVHVDLTDYARRPKHNVTLHNGTTVRTNCPSGTIHLAASQTRVVITLPTGCPFAFGNDDLSTFGGNTYGGRYAALIGTQGDGINFGSSTFSQQSYMDGNAHGNDGRSAIAALNDANGADAPDWLRDYDYYPDNDEELFIDVQYLLSGRVFVRYPAQTVGDNADLFGEPATKNE
ncbi:PspC domain-containing protein [Bifidobacterium simiiventris]|uniref:PspC domain-containing protein n=1 Tax=Bifidobacterium simiiventris TaxID=2834434 RepID=UPI001C58E9A4|nr:PspC domain-containing protein [Bifidobacterium simiiventris]MBW3078663.1 PspC domain-containing protein [Bifidobacterium simiiventris]